MSKKTHSNSIYSLCLTFFFSVPFQEAPLAELRTNSSPLNLLILIYSKFVFFPKKKKKILISSEYVYIFLKVEIKSNPILLFKFKRNSFLVIQQNT